MITEKIRDHFETKKYCKIIRKVGKGIEKTNNGYIVGYSRNFLIIQEADEFELNGYKILPNTQIKKIRYNKWDKYYEKIMLWEGCKDNVGITHKIDLNSWQSIFNSIQVCGLNVAVECESPEIGSFTIGPLVKTSKKHVYIQNFDPAGVLDDDPTSIDFKSITSIMFDDRYTNTFSKYLRQRKSKA